MRKDIPMQSVSSSNIAAVGYDVDSKTLRVRFNSGPTYDYRGVPERLYHELVGAESVGQFFHQNIRLDFPYSKI